MQWNAVRTRLSRSELFDSRSHVFLSLVAAIVAVGLVAMVVGALASIGEAWELITARSRQLLVGQVSDAYDSRIYAHIYVVAAFAGIAWGYMGRLSVPIVVIGVALVAITVGVDSDASTKALVLGALVVVGAGFAAGRYLLNAMPAFRRSAGRWFGLGWLALIVYSPLVLIGFGGIPVSQMGGFYLNVMLAFAIVTVATPIGLLIALAATPGVSPRPIRSLARLYTEIVRGLPLLPLLIFAFLVNDAALGAIGINMGSPLHAVFGEPLKRISMVFVLFTAAYVAVGLQGGIRAVPVGQIEAARTLGLSKLQIWRRIILVQALRPAIPFLMRLLTNVIAATSLVSLVGHTDLIGTMLSTMDSPEFANIQPQMLAAVAAMFWTVAFVLTRASRRLERWLDRGDA